LSLSYGLNRRYKIPYKQKDIINGCSVNDCKNQSTPRTTLCKFHLRRKHLGIELERKKGIRGKLNPNWNGGVSEYPNHYEMKKNRLIVLKKANYICSYCGNKATEIHHVDLSKDNHSLDNLKSACHKCNVRLHNKTKTSKYIRFYGKTLVELSNILGVSRHTILKRHKKIEPELRLWSGAAESQMPNVPDKTALQA